MTIPPRAYFKGAITGNIITRTYARRKQYNICFQFFAISKAHFIHTLLTIGNKAGVFCPYAQLRPNLQSCVLTWRRPLHPVEPPSGAGQLYDVRLQP